MEFPSKEGKGTGPPATSSKKVGEGSVRGTPYGGSDGEQKPPSQCKQSGSSSAAKETCNISEIQGDLFSCPSQFSLVHCVSADLAMGKGIATLFKKKFGGVAELRAQGELACAGWFLCPL